MRVSSFAEIEPEFIERAHRMVWCDMATVGPRWPSAHPHRSSGVGGQHPPGYAEKNSQEYCTGVLTTGLSLDTNDIPWITRKHILRVAVLIAKPIDAPAPRLALVVPIHSNFPRSCLALKRFRGE